MSVIDSGMGPLLNLLWFDFFFFPSPSQLASLEEGSQTVVTALERKDKLHTLKCIFSNTPLPSVTRLYQISLDFDNEKQTIP